jgi:D-glycero-D-manno-heptose 1,7-bisphosphate phosphatase
VKRTDVGIFFDRDGTINTEVDYLSRPEELHLLPNAARAIRAANTYGVKVFIITNQSGVARGLLSERDLMQIHDRLRQLLAREGASIDALYYCPHHPDYGVEPYRTSCRCRKPGPGMLEQAAREHGITLSASYVVGDRCIDVRAGQEVQCGTILVLTGYGQAECEECLTSARVDYVANDAYGAWLYIKQQLEERKNARS